MKMGLGVRMGRRLLSFLLVGIIVVGCTNAQGNSDTANPSISLAPSTQPSTAKSQSQSPSASSSPSLGPSLSEQPSHEPSKVPTISTAPSTSNVPSLRPSLSDALSEAPSLSEVPSVTASQIPSTGISQAPSSFSFPSDLTPQSNAPSGSMSPSFSSSESPSGSSFPSRLPSTSPTKSWQPTIMPSLSLEPTASTKPSREQLRPLVEWKMLVANRFTRSFTDLETETTATTSTATTTDPDPDTIVITATNTTSVRLGEQPSTPILAMTGQSTIELNEWVDVTNYQKVQMLFWFYSRRNQANVESDRFVVEYANRTSADGNGSWITLKTYQRGRDRFRRNDRWYLGRVIISTPDLQAVHFRFQSFYLTSTKMVLLDKFGILGFEKDEVETTNEADGRGRNHNSLSSNNSQERRNPNGSVTTEPIRNKSTNLTADESTNLTGSTSSQPKKSQRRGGPNRSVSMDKSANVTTDDDGALLSHPKESQLRGGPNRSDSLQPIRVKLTNLTVDEVWMSQPLV